LRSEPAFEANDQVTALIGQVHHRIHPRGTRARANGVQQQHRGAGEAPAQMPVVRAELLDIACVESGGVDRPIPWISAFHADREKNAWVRSCDPVRAESAPVRIPVTVRGGPLHALTESREQRIAG
jgi:hypothetical protein